MIVQVPKKQAQVTGEYLQAKVNYMSCISINSSKPLKKNNGHDCISHQIHANYESGKKVLTTLIRRQTNRTGLHSECKIRQKEEKGKLKTELNLQPTPSCPLKENSDFPKRLTNIMKQYKKYNREIEFLDQETQP